jgi:probable rRNA maturation factor
MSRFSRPMSQFEIEVQAQFEITPAQQQVVYEAATAALTDLGQPRGAACTILLTGDERIRALNRDFLDNDSVTDVLSFPAGEPTPGADAYLGDVAISVPAAMRQAASGGHSLDAELQLLAVHAVLHLLGYDHGTASEREAMWSAQAQILAGIGAEITGPKSE